MKPSKNDYKYKVCPIEYTTQPGGNGQQLNTAMENRFKDTPGDKYTIRRHFRIARLTERLFNMKIFYGMNSYWVSSYK